jgi:chemotaxis protein MotB
MSNDGFDEQIIIRKRRGDDDEGHHGGVWKLAFADFMTAMMAFFLVMWLINSTSKETKAAIVQYFNPVQLIDSNPAHKGLRDPAETGQGKSNQRQVSVDGGARGEAGPEAKAQSSEAALHSEPLEVLEDIASRELPSPANKESPRAARHATPSFGDPFDRMDQDSDAAAEHDTAPAAPAPKPSMSSEDTGEKAAREPAAASLHAKEGATKQKQLSHPHAIEEQRTAALSTAAAMQAELEEIIGHESRRLRGAPRVFVTQSEEGLLISLTDDANFSMFNVGSIEPKPQLVRVIGRIGRILAEQTGDVEIRGHTDGRSYKTSAYDNWRLSSDRATVTNYMLVRGGLAESRVTKISGYADRRPKASNDRFAAVNRRIEILVRGDRR